jgi:hypothetical protein
MPSKRNPLNLNPLQLKTLTLLQELGRVAGKPAAEDEPGGLAITQLPDPHGDHFHLGEAIVAARSARNTTLGCGIRSCIAASISSDGYQTKRAAAATGHNPSLLSAAAMRSGSSTPSLLNSSA